MPFPTNSCNSCNNNCRCAPSINANIKCAPPLKFIRDSVNVSGSSVDISGQFVNVDISGQFVNVDISGQFVNVDISGQFVNVDISGQFVNVDISGQFVNVDISGQHVIADISGQFVNVDISGQHVIADISGQFVNVDISGQFVKVDISGQHVIADLSGQSVVAYQPPMSLDAFGRLRVSNPYTLGDYKHVYGLNTNFFDASFNGGSITFEPYKSCALLDSSVNSTGYAIHQTKIYHNYLPGKSQYVYSTFCFIASATNVTKRSGYFDASNGIFLELQDASLNFCIRSDASGGVLTLETAPQSTWNIDKCNGTGLSGFNLDITKAQIFFTDFEWLGVGKVRCGFINEKAELIIAHEFRHANSVTYPYMRTPNLPIRCEVRNTGIPSPLSNNKMRQICSTVISEGGDSNVGQLWSNLIKNLTEYNVTNSTSFPIMALRLKSQYQGYENRMFAIITQYNMVSDTAAYYRFIKVPDSTYLSNPSWVSDSSNSGVEISIRDGHQVTDMNYAKAIDNYCFVYDSGYLSAGSPGGSAKGNNTSITTETSKQNYIVRTFNNSDSEVYVIEIRSLGGNASVYAAVQWREIY
jgi:hypothetical protein